MRASQLEHGRRVPWLSSWRREAIWAYLFLLPALLGLVVFLLIPLVGSFLLAFTDWDGMSPLRFNGISNYVNIVTSDPMFAKVLGNSVYYAVGSVILTTIPALLFALLININQIRGRLVFRAIYFTPFITMMVAAAILWRWIYDLEIGLINYLLGFLHIHKIAWLGNANIAMASLIIVSGWKNMGFSMAIFLAGLQNIPRTFYESAEMDGAGALRKFTNVTMPLLSPTMFFIIVISLIGSLQAFDIIYIMTRGGPNLATSTMVYYIYQNAFQDFRMGYASTVAWILFVIILAATLVQFRLQKRWVHYQ
jgi:multiple sugar transport system permease protein